MTLAEPTFDSTKTNLFVEHSFCCDLVLCVRTKFPTDIIVIDGGNGLDDVIPSEDAEGDSGRTPETWVVVPGLCIRSINAHPEIFYHVLHIVAATIY